VRWSWGYHVLLAPPDKYADEDAGRNSAQEEGRYHDEPALDARRELLVDVPDEEEMNGKPQRVQTDSDYGSGAATPRDPYDSSPTLSGSEIDARSTDGVLPTAANRGQVSTRLNESTGHITTFPNPSPSPTYNENAPKGIKAYWQKSKATISSYLRAFSSKLRTLSRRTLHTLPLWLQKALTYVSSFVGRFLNGLWEFMNPPLWAMLAAIIVASVPPLQHLFFDRHTFVSNSVTRAIAQSGGVAVPLILVVLGANLARNTLPKDQLEATKEDKKEERNLLIASLVSRMLIPTILMAPLLALTAKYVPVSILDDPIFVIVCFLLTGAPSALQLAQICQINNVYMGAMARLLFQSYVVWILPSTLVLVMLALEVVEWAARP